MLFRHAVRFDLLGLVSRRHGLIRAITLDGVSYRHSSYLNIQKEDGYAIMQMCKPPMNSHNKALYLEMKDAILDLENDKDIQGLIITSACPKFFTAGIDLKELLHRSLDEVQDFWKVVQDWWLIQYGSRLAIIAAINGHCFAAGTLTALTCDYRIMARGPYTIGLNEAKRDIILPFWMRDLLQNTVGYREAEKAFQLGLSYVAEDALRVGMVDELVDEENVLERAREEMTTWLEISGTTRHECKLKMRTSLMKQLQERRDEDALQVAKQITSQRVQQNVEEFIQGKRK